MRWWQIRTSDFAVFLLAIILQRALVLPLWIVAATFADTPDMSLARALDETYLGWHGVGTVFHIYTLAWVYLGICILSTVIERPYGRIKFFIIFGGLIALLAFSHRNALQVLTMNEIGF